MFNNKILKTLNALGLYFFNKYYKQYEYVKNKYESIHTIFCLYALNFPFDNKYYAVNIPKGVR